MFGKTLKLLFIIFTLSLGQSHAASFDQQHTLWQQVLSRYVKEEGAQSRVDYQGLKNNNTVLQQYLAQLSAVDKQTYDAWNKAQQLAFLINAYNAFTIKLILDHYPLKSIREIGSVFHNAWKMKFFTFLGEKTHLDHIEHELIRGKNGFNEPRIHFALVCASIGCPKLHATAFTAQNLEQLLEQGTRAFLQDSQRNRYDDKHGKLYLSSIFRWYGKDFKKTHGSVEAFVARYITTDPAQQAQIKKQDVEIEYLDYDWSLNDT